MANCYGGVTILDVVENSYGSLRTTGLQNAAKLKKDFWNCVNNPVKVSVNLLMEEDVETFDINGDVVMVVRVPRARREQRPVYVNNILWNGTYRRKWEGDYQCSQSEIRAMLRDEPEETIDMTVLEEFTLNDLNDEPIRGYRNYHSAVSPGHVWEKLSKADYLERIGAAGRARGSDRLHPTAAGLLMFGEEYRIVRYFSEYFLDYRDVLDPSIRWTDRIQSSSGDWTGNRFDFFFRACNKLIRDIEKPFALDGLTRIEDTPVHKAVREAFANCIVNTDFYLPRGIVVLKERNKIIMQNPGSIRTGKDQMLRGGVSDPRNKAIMKMLNLISIGERAGSGVPNICSVWASKGWNDPVVEEQYAPDRTVLTLMFTEKQAEKQEDEQAEKETKKQLGKANRKNIQEEQVRKTSGKTSGNGLGSKTIVHKDKIILMIRRQKSASFSEIAEYIKLSSARTRVLLGQLVEEGYVVAKGEGRARRYFATDK